MLANPWLFQIKRFYLLFVKTGSNLQSLFLLYMRITWGHQFLLIGLGKLLAIEHTAAFFTALQFPHPMAHAYLIGCLETVCGFCLFAGFASRIAALPMIIVTLTALSTAHAPEISNFQFLLAPLALSRQPPYPFLIASLMIFVFGPGRISVDGWLKRWIKSQAKY